MPSFMSAPCEIDASYPLRESQIAAFRKDGFVRLRDVFEGESLARYEEAITARVEELNETMRLDWKKRDRYQKAFVQVMNIWQRDEIVREFVFSKRLARIAAELMGVNAVRLYHDQALYKEPRAGRDQNDSPWHADQYYWPLDTPYTCTVWVPLQEVPLEMGPLSFARGSHRLAFGRDLEMSDEGAPLLEAEFDKAGMEESSGPFDLGEVSFHQGWTYHRAGPNRTESIRKVMTIIYFVDGAKVTHPANLYQENDWRTWLPGTRIGEPAASAINPLLYHLTL